MRLAMEGSLPQEGMSPQRMKAALFPASVPRIARTCWVGAML